MADLTVKTRAHIFVRGDVQGVFFRQETKHRAGNLNVKGWVRNLFPSGLEAVFEGEEKDVQTLISFCKRGPPGANVTDVEVGQEDYVGEFKDFKIRYD